MDAPPAKELAEAVNISLSYASMILNNSDDPTRSRTPPKALAVLIFRKTQWRHRSIADMTEDRMEAAEELYPWSPRKAAA